MKLKAFTLMELVIGMIISTIVIAFGSTALRLAQKQLSSYRGMKNELMDISMFQSVFSNDVFNSDNLSGKETDIFVNKGIDYIEYTFGEKYILRTNKEHIDTFKIATSEVKIEYLISDSEGTIESVEFNGEVRNEKWSFCFSKDYDASIKINSGKNDWNRN